MKEKLVNQIQFDETMDCQVSLVYNKLNDGYRYDIILNCHYVKSLQLNNTFL